MRDAMTRIVGYHGTSTANANAIIKEGFKMSKGDEQWLGDGVYFFIKGISQHPDIQAEDWANVSAWNKTKQRNDYSFFSILKSMIEIDEDKTLDLTTNEGIEILDYLQEKCKSKLLKLGIPKFPIDGQLINLARVENIFEIDASIGNFYIKLNKFDRINNLTRRTPNSTIAAIYNNSTIIDTVIYKKGRVL